MIPLDADEIMILARANVVLRAKMGVDDSIGAYRVLRAHSAIRTVLRHGVLTARSNAEPRNG